MLACIRRKSLTVALACALVGIHTGRAVTFEIADPVEFSRIIDTNAVLTTNATIDTWLEGPVWIPAGQFLVFCDQNNNRLKKLVPPNTFTDYLLPPANTKFNGCILDAQEQLIAAEAGSGGQRISMLTNLVSVTASDVAIGLITNYNGLKFYSPNDVAVKSDGTIWFTDPGYNSGITKPHAGYPPGYWVYRFNPTNANATCQPVMTNDFGRVSGIPRPNGLCFSPDESKLYISDSDSTSAGHRIYVYSVTASNTLTGGAVFANVTNGIPDGIKCDADGRVWSSGGDAVYIFAPNDGHLIGKIKYLRTVNLCWGGPDYHTLYIVGQPLVTSIPVRVTGTPALKKLESSFTSGQLNLSWPAPSTGFELQETSELTQPDSWTNSPLTAATTNDQKTVTVDSTNVAKFFRLRLN